MKKAGPFSAIIEKISSRGEGIGTIEKADTSSKVKVAIAATVPGDEVTTEIVGKKKGVYIGSLLTVSSPSSLRVEPRCKHVSFCGGCSLQQMDYAAQLSHKESELHAAFSPLFSGKICPIIPASSPWMYRNKMEYTFSQDREKNRFLGLMKVHTKGRVEPITECYLAPEWFISLLAEVRLWWEESNLLAFHLHNNTGSLRTLTLREGKKTGQKMVILTVSGCAEYALHRKHLDAFVTCVHKVIPKEENPSIFLCVQQAIAGSPTQFYEMQLSGPAHICEELEIVCDSYKKSYRFAISPTAFFQPNTLQAEKIYAVALQMAGLTPKKLVFDLYAGTATLGMIFSSFAEKVIAIEMNPYAVFDAEYNKAHNAIENLQITKGDVAKVLKELYEKEPTLERPDLIVLDPPRMGLSLQAVQVVLQLAPETIIYISCAPLAQARDCQILLENGYVITDIQPIDQFPHTVHVENVVKLQQKKQ
jgi:23S rRNA (uracil1939-C5)-methyltransferase